MSTFSTSHIGVVNETLEAFLTSNLKPSNKITVAVGEKDLASAIAELGYRSFVSLICPMSPLLTCFRPPHKCRSFSGASEAISTAS